MQGSQLIFLLLMVGLLVFMFSRTRRQQRAQQQMQGSVAPGAEVMTGSGLYGTVVSIDDDVVTLEVAPGVQQRWHRRAVSRVITPAPTAEAEAGLASGAAPEPAVGGLDLRKDGDAADAPVYGPTDGETRRP